MFQPSYGIITDLAELREYVDRILGEGRAFSWDIETGYHGESREKASLHPEENFIAGLSLTNSLKFSRYVPLNHDTGVNVDQKAVAEILYPLLVKARGADGQPLGVAHGGKFELRVTRPWLQAQLGIELDYRAFRLRSDTMLESYAEAVNRFHGLKDLSELQAETDRSGFWHKQLELEELYPDKLTAKQKKCIRFNVLDPSLPNVQRYVCEDTLYTLAHHRLRFGRLQQALAESPHRGPGFIWKLEMAVLPVVCEAEDEGLWYDWLAMRDWAAKGKDFASRYMEEIREDFGKLRGEPLPPTFNFGSPPQLARLLYEDCDMPVRHWTKGGKTGAKKPGTDAKLALKTLSAEYPEVAKYLQWKRLTKLYRDFLIAFEVKYCFAEDRRAHPSLLQHGVPAGRFAHADPNYAQCVPGDYSVLTPQGWRRLDTLRDDESVAQYHPDGRVSFTVPSEVVRQPYNGPMAGIRSLEGGDWKYTLEHRLVYRKRRRQRVAGVLKDAGDSEVMEMTAAQWSAALQLRPEMFSDGRHMLNDVKDIRAGRKEIGISLDEREAWVMRLAVACQAEGNRRTDGRGGAVWYDVELRSERKQAQFAEIAEALGLEFRETNRGRRCRVPGHLAGLWLDEGKNFTPCEVFRLSAGWLREFIAEVMRWDGSSTTGRSYGQKDTRRSSVDVVQAAAVLCGYTAQLHEHDQLDGHYVTVELTDKETKFSGAQWSYPAWITGRVYCVRVPTGMFLVRNPEGYVQVTGNSPKKYHYELRDGDVFHFNFREMIGAPPGWYMLGFDLAQAELRAVAGMAQEAKMVQAFLDNVDVHSVTASLIFGVPVSEVTKEQRDVGKTMGLALVYGLTEDGLAERLGITRQEAEDLFAAFHAAYPKIKEWTEKTIASARETGYVETWWGRRVRIWNYVDADQSGSAWLARQRRADGDRTAGNAPVQGSATGDYMKLAMVRAEAALRKAGLKDKVRLVMNVHDALEYYVHKSLKPVDVIRVLQPAVIFPVSGWPPLLAEWHCGERWGDVKELDVGLGPDRSVTSVRLKAGAVAEELEIELGEEDEEDVVPATRVALSALAVRGERAGYPDQGPGDREAAPVEGLAAGADVAPGSVPAGLGGDSAPGRVVVITPRGPVARDDLGYLVAMLRATPGPNTVKVHLAGQLVQMTGTFGLTPEHEAQVSVMLGGATVRYDEASVDLVALGAGVIALWKSEAAGTASTPARSMMSPWTRATCPGFSTPPASRWRLSRSSPSRRPTRCCTSRLRSSPGRPLSCSIPASARR